MWLKSIKENNERFNYLLNLLWKCEWLAAKNEISASRVRISAEFVAFTFTQISLVKDKN